MKEIMETIESNLTEKVVGIGKKKNVILGIVFGSLVVLGVYNMGQHVGEYLYYILH